MIRFDLNLKTNTGVVDSTFTPINVPGDPAVAGLDLAWNGTATRHPGQLGHDRLCLQRDHRRVRRVVHRREFVHRVLAHQLDRRDRYADRSRQLPDQPALRDQPDCEPPDRSGPAGYGQSATIYAASRSSPSWAASPARPARTSSSPRSRLTSIRPSPTMTQLGIQAVSTASVTTVKGQGSVLSNQLSALASTAVKQHGAFVNVPAVQPATGPPGQALGSIDQSLALVTSASGGTNTLTTETGTLTLNLPQPARRPERNLPARPGRLGLDRHPGNRPVNPRRHGNRNGLERHRQLEPGQVPVRRPTRRSSASPSATFSSRNARMSSILTPIAHRRAAATA